MAKEIEMEIEKWMEEGQVGVMQEKRMQEEGYQMQMKQEER